MSLRLPCPAPDAAVLVLVRHAATANNLANPPRVQGRGSDLPLAGDGRAQATKTGQFLSTLPLTAVYSSPLERARQTAAQIAGPHHLAVEPVAALTECDVGRWEGRTWAEIEADDAEAHRLFREDPSMHPYAGGENLSQVVRRVAPALEEILAANLGRVVAAVAHNVVNRSYLADLLGLPLVRARGIPQDNCGINLLRYRGGRVKILTLNATFHLA